MMYNKVILIGRLVAAPELHKTSTDKSSCPSDRCGQSSLQGPKRGSETDFVNVVVWGNWLKPWLVMPVKGSLISLDGEIRTRRYEKNGVMQYVTEVLCQSFQLLESQGSTGYALKMVEQEIWPILS